MAIITCPECNKEMSDQASQCPNCGAPNKKVQKQKNGMKTAMLILGIIGSFIAFGGGIGTVVGGFASAGLSAIGSQGATDVINNGVDISNQTFQNSAFIFWSGVLSLVIATISLIASIIGGVAQRKNTILIFATSVFISGLINIYLYNWFSGALITISGLLGIFGAKSGTVDDKTIKQEISFYLMLMIMIASVVSSITIKNGSKINQATNTEINASDVALETNETAPAVETPSPEMHTNTSQQQLPFIGKRTYSFYGGNASINTISIDKTGHTIIQLCGRENCETEYEGNFENPIKIVAQAYGSTSLLSFKGNKVSLLDANGEAQVGCNNEFTPCEAELYKEETF